MSAEDTSPPLSGIRVVDLGSTIAGMTASMLLADLGADVVRFDDRAVEDELPGEAMWHRGKLIAPRDAATEQRAIADCDVLVTTDRDGAERYAAVRAEHPQLIHLDLTPMLPLEHGPETYEAFLGAYYAAATRQSSFDGGPVELVVPFISYEQGIWGATAAIAALVEREKSGLGQHVVVDDLHGTLVACSTVLTLDPEAPAPFTAFGPSGPSANYSPYRCSDGKWMFLASLSTKFQEAAFAGIGVEILGDERIQNDPEKLRQNYKWARETIAAAIAQKPRQHWIDLLRELDVPCAPLDEPEEWIENPQLAAIDQRIELDDPRRGRTVMPGIPVELHGTPAGTPRPRRYGGFTGWPKPRNEPAVTGDAPKPGQGPLGGVTVLDLGTVVAGPFAGRMLADLGADVIKVETLEGDGFRVTGFHTNRGQRSIAIDLRNPVGAAAFRRIVAASDAVVDNYRPGVLGRLGIDWESLAQVNPGIISASISGFGGRGPIGMNPGYDPVLQAMSGMMNVQGGDSDPVFHTLAANDITAGVGTALGVSTALYARARRGFGQRVATSLATVSAYMLCGELVKYAGRPPVRRGGRDYPGPRPESRFYATSDGWVRLHAESRQALVDAGLGVSDGEGFESQLADALSALSTEEAIARLTAAGVAAVQGRTVADLAHDESLLDGRYLEDITRGDGKTFLVPGRYARFSRTELAARLTPSGLGEFTRPILAAAGLNEEEVEEAFSSGAVIEGPPLTSFGAVNYR